MKKSSSECRRLNREVTKNARAHIFLTYNLKLNVEKVILVALLSERSSHFIIKKLTNKTNQLKIPLSLLKAEMFHVFDKRKQSIPAGALKVVQDRWFAWEWRGGNKHEEE